MNKLDIDIVNETIKYDIVPFDSLDDYFVILTKDGIFAPRQGRIFHTTYKDAWKHWYNQMHRRVKKEYKAKYAKSQGYTGYWKCPSFPLANRQIWEAFKVSMLEDLDFKIIQWKDAKRDVCGESRA